MCDFPARQLLEHAHKVVTQTDPFGNPAKLTYACGFIKTMNDLRAYHEDLTDCHCWDEALTELGYLPPPIRLQGGN